MTHSPTLSVWHLSSCYRITVTFNVNNSIPPSFDEEADQAQQKPAEDEVGLSELVKTSNDSMKDACENAPKEAARVILIVKWKMQWKYL